MRPFLSAGRQQGAGDDGITSNLIDRPAFADEDSLNMKAYADALKEFIADAEAPLTIALQGEWAVARHPS